MADPLRGAAAIVGAATFGCGEAPGFEAIELAAQASLMALDDAGLGLADVDGLFVALPQDMLSGLAFSEYLGIRPNFCDNNRTGGSSFEIHVHQAAMALASGVCDVALIAYGSNQRTAGGKLISALVSSVHESAYRPTMPIAGYALAASRYMHQYGATRADLAEVAVAARRWAQLNPEAFVRDPLTIEDCLKARLIADPLSARDCCLVTDGAAAIVLTRADRARDLRKAPVCVLGAGSAITHKEIAGMPDLTVTGAADSGRRAYAMAGVGPADVDVVGVYDAFTINTILFLEDLGFCPKGEGARFVQGGAIAPGGTLPVNTNGGGLSCVHPGMYGLFPLVEGVRQLRGECGARQVAGAQIALCHGNGGVLSSQATVILGTAATA